MTRRMAVLTLPIVLLACNTLQSVATPVATPAPTVEATLASPTVLPTPSLPAEPTPVPGWQTYHNTMMGYSFDYPPSAVLTTTGVNGFPSEELPAGLGPGDYIATLEATYTEGLCASLQFPAAFFVVWPPQDKGGKYAGPCGVTGFGVYDLRKDEVPITVDGEDAMLRTTRVYQVGTDTLVEEVSVVRLADGTLLTLASAWQDAGLTYDDYLADRAVILQVIASYRRHP